MLDVSFSIANLLAMLFGIIHTGSDFELDSLNSPTPKPNLRGDVLLSMRATPRNHWPPRFSGL